MAKDEPDAPPTLAKMPSLLDRELTERLRDAFGHAQFADALRDLIESDAKPPFSIGLLGPWGTGKSTIKSLYLENLRDDKSRRAGKTRADRIFPITFNAWRHGGEEDLKRALLRAAFLQLEGDEADLNRELLHQVSKTAQVRRTWKEILFDAFGQLSVGLVIIAILFLLVTLALYLLLSKLGVVNVFSVVTFLIASAALTERLAKYLLDMRVKAPVVSTPQTTIAFPSRSGEEYESLLMQQVQAFRREKKKDIERLVVFVDDLDRLSATEMVRGLAGC